MKFNSKSLIYFQIIYNCVIKFFIIDLGLPSILNYVTDLVTAYLFFEAYRSRKNGVKIRVNPLIIVIVMLIVSTLSFLSDFSSPLLYIWSFRNVYRFFAFFYACIYLLEIEDIYKIFNILEKIFIANVVVCIYEYFVRGIKFDFLGGLFGNGVTGGNGPLNALMVVVSVYVIIEYLNHKKKLIEVLFIIACCLLISAIAELKFYFFELILLAAIILIFIKRNFKMLSTVVLVCIVGSVAMSIYSQLYPNSSDFLSLEFIQKYTADSTYGEATDINRLSAIGVIEERFFKDNWKYSMFGLGMGNGETAQFSLLVSDFYRAYGNRIKYNWFSHVFTFVEGGYIGLILYASFFVVILIKNIRMIKNNELGQIGMLCSVICIALLVYNQTLRVETMGYTMFFTLAIPYIQERISKRKLMNNEKT